MVIIQRHTWMSLKRRDQFYLTLAGTLARETDWAIEESESFIEMTDAYDNFHGGYDVVEEEHDCDETCELCPHGICADWEYCDASEEEE